MSVTTITIPAKGTRPVKYVVSRVYGICRQEFANQADAAVYAASLSA